MNSYELMSFGGFILLITLMLALDLGVFHKKDHVIGFREAAVWTCVWIGMALVFYVGIYFFAEWIHGIDTFDKLEAINTRHGHNLKLDAALGLEANLAMYRKAMSMEYLTGYFVEKSLSIDNIFVMILIFSSFKVDKIYYHRVLFWGIIGAIVLRFVFIFLSAVLIQKFSWILGVFGGLLIVSGVKMLFDKDREEIDTQNHPAVRFASKYFRLLPETVGHAFFVRRDGKLFMTTLFLVLLVIEFSDVIFAVDSIPAIFSVTQDPFVVFFSNIFAILGLRSLFFLLSNVMSKFRYLNYGLAVLLAFIGGKMLIDIIWHAKMSAGTSLLVILGIITVSVVASIAFAPKETAEASAGNGVEKE